MIFTHNYIDPQIRSDFTANITIEDIVKDLKAYNIQNIRDDGDEECLYFVAQTLYDDYEFKRANYRSYIEPNMDLRMLTELRKSAVLKHKDDFYLQHKTANTLQDVKNIRIAFYGNLNSDYHDEDWQYMFIARCYLRNEPRPFYFDLEDCYADSPTGKVRGIADYCDDFAQAHLQGCKYTFFD